ncbi:MAG: hypothetical protein K9L17_07185 [Clostridiales bacterium]|nr:hypothetical protein [Clostridiales bacterium]MCF8022455.1 hypothetical protein [Clostridiales bacterium]
MNYKEIGYYIVVIILSILILNFLTLNQIEINDKVERLDVEEIIGLLIINKILGFTLGVLVKWRLVIQYFKGNFGINLKLIPGLLIFLLSFIPSITIAKIFGLGIPFPQGPIGLNIIYAPFLHGNVQLPLSVIAGVLVTEGLYKNKV